MLKAYPTPAVEQEIRRQAAKAGIPITQFLLPYINAVAEGSLKMVPHFPAPSAAPKKDAA